MIRKDSWSRGGGIGGVGKFQGMGWGWESLWSRLTKSTTINTIPFNSQIRLVYPWLLLKFFTTMIPLLCAYSHVTPVPDDDSWTFQSSQDANGHFFLPLIFISTNSFSPYKFLRSCWCIVSLHSSQSSPHHNTMQRALSSRVRASALSSASRTRPSNINHQQLRFAHKVC